MFTIGQFSFKYGRFMFTACWEVVSCYLTTGWQELPDKTVTVQDKRGSVSSKP